MPLRAPTKDYSGRGGLGGGYQGIGLISTIREEQADLRTLLNALWQKDAKYIDRRDSVEIPVGIRNVPLEQPRDWVSKLPQLDVRAPTTTRPPLPQQIVEQPPAPDTRNVPVQIVDDWFSYHDLAAKGIAVKHSGSGSVANATSNSVAIVPSTNQTPVSIPVATPTKKSTGGGSMDLGALFGDLATTYIQTRYAQPAPVQAQPAYSVFDAGSDIIDYFTDPATGTVVPVKKKKPCRRRRKRLATKSDLGDLAALKAILGNGEAFKAWIATHSR